MKLYNSFIVAYQSVKNDKMMSAYMSEFVSYNVLDADYLEDKCKESDDKESDDKCKESDDKEEIQIEEIIPIVEEEN
jgi:hypothetical protein